MTSNARACGPALVLVYEGGTRVAALFHEHDGGEHYMGPVIRRAIAYAKTHYDCGNIADILRSEPEMRDADLDVLYLARSYGIRHFYYIAYRWDEHARKKNYRAYVRHTGPDTYVEDETVPDMWVSNPPGSAAL